MAETLEAVALRLPLDAVQPTTSPALRGAVGRLSLGTVISQARQVTVYRGDFCIDLESAAVRGSPDRSDL
jgi:hypothetical protein